MNKAKVLFLCTGNSARSQMAEALLRSAAGDRFDAFSAGLRPREVHPLAVQAMAEAGIDLGNQRAKSVSEFLGHVHFGFLITLCDRALADCPTFPGIATRLHWPIDDPAVARGSEAEQLAVFRRVRDELTQRIAAFVQEH